MSRDRILASGRWREEGKGIRPWANNGEMLADVAKLYIPPNARVLDPTYGQGNWWSEYRPRKLVAHDLATDGVDFRYLPGHRARSFDVVAFDPPYVSKGGRETSTIPAFYEAYGLKGAPKSPAALQELINAGADEAWRVLRPGGVLLQRSMNYVSSGRVVWSTLRTIEHNIRHFDLVDEFIFVSPPGPQPLKRKVRNKVTGEIEKIEVPQQHAAHNASSLLVFRKR